MEFILAQIFGGIALLLVVVSYFWKDKKVFLMLQVVANIFYGLSFVFSSALVFGINSFISIVRVIVLYVYEKKNMPPPIYLVIPFVLSYLTVGIIFYQQPIDIIGIFTPMLFTIAMWMKNMQLVRYLMLLPNALLVLSALLYSAYTTALLDAVEIAAIVVAIITFHLKKHNTKWLL